MSKAKVESSTDSTARLVERLALATAVFLVPLVFATGLSQYEVLKRGVLGVLGGVVLATWVWDVCRARLPRRLGGGASSLVLWLFVIYSAASLLWAELAVRSLPDLLLWLTLGAIFVSAASRTRGPDWIALPLIASGVLVSLSMLAMRLGVELIPPIPTGMAHDAGARGSFDHVVFAGAALVVVGPVALYRAAVLRGGLRWGLLVAAVLIELAVGLSGSALSVIAIGTLVVGALVGFGHLKGADGAVATWAVAALAVLAVVAGRFGLEPLEAEVQSEPIPGMARTVYQLHGVGGIENAIVDASEWDFEWSRGLRVWSEARLLGHGLGTWDYHAGRLIDQEHEYYANLSDEYHIHQSPSGFVSGILVELGLAGLLLWIVFLFAVAIAAIRGLRHPDEGDRSGSGFLFGAALAAIAVGLLTPAAYHAGEGVAVFAVLGLAVRLQREDTAGGFAGPTTIPAARSRFDRFERWLLIGIPALLLLGAGLWREGRAVVADFQRQRGELFLVARQHEDAIDALEKAVAFDPDDYRSQYLLGVARYYTPTDDARRTAARQSLRRAADLWPNDARVVVQTLRTGMQDAAGSMEDRLDAAGRTRNRLRELLELDPRNAEIHIQLSDALRVLGDYDEAAGVLIELTTMHSDERVLASTHLAIGQVYEENLSDPERALEHYQLALSYAQEGSPLARNLAERISFVEVWLERGSPPQVAPHNH